MEEHFRPGTAKVFNTAASGRSTKTFIEEGRWAKTLEEKPNYVFIQFGHNDSHEPDLIEKVTKIECYHMEQFAYFVEKLKATADGAGSLLDNCVIAYGAAMGDPNRHDHKLCPTVIAGRAGGKIRTGRHVAYKEGTPLANLHLTMLDVSAVPTDKLGNSNGKLDFLGDV